MSRSVIHIGSWDEFARRLPPNPDPLREPTLIEIWTRIPVVEDRDLDPLQWQYRVDGEVTHEGTFEPLKRDADLPVVRFLRGDIDVAEYNAELGLRDDGDLQVPS